MLDGATPNDVLAALQNEKAWKRAIHRDQVKYNSKVNSLRFSIAQGDFDGVAQNQSWLLNSPSSKRVAAAQLLRAGKDLDVCTYPDLKVLTESVTPFEPMDEPVLVFAKEKHSKRGYRTICSFGDRHRVAHRLSANILDAHLVSRSFQLNDVGVPKAIFRILKSIDAGQVWLAHLDIKDFFPSSTQEGLIDLLPLPPAVVEAVLTGQDVVLKSGPLPIGYPHSVRHLIKEARRGLPQGAASSPVISHLCLSWLTVDAAVLEYLFNYADDFLLMATSKADLEQKIAKLTDAVGSLPGGQFSLSVKTISHASAGIDFLGHRLLMRNKEAIAEPSETNLAKLVVHLHRVDEDSKVFSGQKWKIYPLILAQACADKLAILHSWKAAFQACMVTTEVWSYVEGLEHEVHSDLASHGLNAFELPSPTKHIAPKLRRFYFYKWFS